MRAILALLLFAPVPHAQTVIYVDADATGADTGLSWSDAFTDLESALAQAQDGDEVWVAEGVYARADGFRAPPVALALYGGFDGLETQRDQRNWRVHRTVLHASSAAALTIIDAELTVDGFEVDAGDIGILSTSSTAIIRNVHIYGGALAMQATGGHVTLDHAVIADNQAAVRASTTDLVLFHTSILQNQTVESVHDAGTGGLTVLESTLRIEDSLIEENGSTSPNATGGGLHLSASQATILRTHFIRNRLDAEQNYVRVEGGGVYVDADSEAAFQNCTFAGNRAEGRTGAGHTGSIEALGGAIASYGTTTCTNCVFVGNSVYIYTNEFGEARGSAIHSTGELTLLTSTVAGNSTEAFDENPWGTIDAKGVTLSNTIAWDNAGAAALTTTGTSAVSYALIEGGYLFGDQILDADPLVHRLPHPGPDGWWGTPDDDYGDLRLQPGSPALDFGSAALLPPDTYDLDGDGDTTEPLPLNIEGGARVMGAAPDLGAHEGAVGVSVKPSGAVTTFALHGAYPNPFNPSTRIAFDLPLDGDVTLTLFDALGREVAVLGPKPVAAGLRRSLTVNSTGLSSGLYLYRLTASFGTRTRTATGTLTLLK